MAEENQHTNPSQEQPEESTPTLPLPRPYNMHMPGSNTGSRREWPELVGLSAEEAERKIKEEMVGAKVQVVPPNSFVTMDFRNNRVRLYIDTSGNVNRTPMIG